MDADDSDRSRVVLADSGVQCEALPASVVQLIFGQVDH